MPLYIGDYFAKTVHLSLEEDGAYLRLLMAMWASNGILVNDAKLLARICKVSVAKWRKIAPVILPFFDVENDNLTSAKMQEIAQKYEEKVAKNKEAGKRGGEAKSLTNKETPLANATNSLKQPKPKLDNIDKSILEKEKKDLDFGFQDFYSKYPNKVSKPVSKAAYEKQRKNYSHEQIMDGLERYIQSKPPDRAWCNPSTFLNQERFNDEPSNTIQAASNYHENNNAGARQKPRNAIDNLVARAFELNATNGDDDFACRQPSLRIGTRS